MINPMGDYVGSRYIHLQLSRLRYPWCCHPRIFLAYPGVGVNGLLSADDSHGLPIVELNDRHFKTTTSYLKRTRFYLRQGISVFMVFSRDVIDKLNELNLEYVSIYPDMSLKEEYATRHRLTGMGLSVRKELYRNWEYTLSYNTVAQGRHVVLQSQEYLPSLKYLFSL